MLQRKRYDMIVVLFWMVSSSAWYDRLHLASPNERTDDDVGASWMLAHLLTKLSLRKI